MIEADSFDRIMFITDDYNEYDKNAVKAVFEDMDGERHVVGFVSKDHTQAVRDLIKEASPPRGMGVMFTCTLEDVKFRNDVLQWFVVKVGPVED